MSRHKHTDYHSTDLYALLANLTYRERLVVSWVGRAYDPEVEFTFARFVTCSGGVLMPVLPQSDIAACIEAGLVTCKRYDQERVLVKLTRLGQQAYDLVIRQSGC